ncbi:uncharacterized protein LOC131428593 [Malaya genurostris]|uniref:uncharacterized protein LOC131428593 n=1 Tax=Malaya genurostris TaxID=325434 RepID=UPI0026F3CD6F|nr:uncharacterized protein LOC131428593 [Malaya genurostris]
METQLRRSSRETRGAIPKRLESFVVEIHKHNTMIRTPQNQNKQLGGKNSDELPEASKPELHSSKTRSSGSSRTDSQIKFLELEENNEEVELQASIERDRIVAEKQLAELQIKHDLALKTEQRKAEFLKRKCERNQKRIELLSNSSSKSTRSSIYTNTSKRVVDWITDSEKVKPYNVYEESSYQMDHPRSRDYGEKNIPTHDRKNVSAIDAMNTDTTEPSTNALLCQAFKALQTRNLKDLPPFSGDVMEWTVFANEFKTSTEEFHLSDRDNLRRLNKALQGKARKAVESLLSSPENVAQILRMLKSNFGRTEWVVANRLEALKNLEPVKEGNIESFRMFYNVIIGTKVAMTYAKADCYLMNPELVSHLVEKLPAFSKQMWIRHKAALIKEGVAIDFNTFSRWLEDEMDNQLASLNPVFSAKKTSYPPKMKPVVLNVNCPDGETAKRCPLCSTHSHVGLDKCDEFRKMSVAQRRSTASSCKVCYICLKSNHSRKNCNSEKKCTICKKNHHELVHSNEPVRYSKYSRTDTQNSQDNVCNINGKNVNTLLRVGRIRISGPKGVKKVFALFDEGSSLSMMDAAIAESIGLRGPISPVTYRWTNGILHKEDQSMRLSFRISGPSEQAKWYEVSNISTVQNIALPPVKFDVATVKRLYPMLDDDKLAAIQDACPCMLIGSNNAGLIVPLKTVQYSLDGLQLTRCHLGWTIHGVIDPSKVESNRHHAYLCSEDDDIELTDLVKQMYKVENFGISEKLTKIADEDLRALDIMNRSITRRSERFEIGQIYKYNNFVFPDSKPQALRRLQIIEKKMDTNPDFAERYCGKIQDYIDKGYARKLEPEELVDTSNTWYLPHFSVETAEKFRLVMDAKAKSHGFSLNDLLLKGPDFVPPLIAI